MLTLPQTYNTYTNIRRKENSRHSSDSQHCIRIGGGVTLPNGRNVSGSIYQNEESFLTASVTQEGQRFRIRIAFHQAPKRPDTDKEPIRAIDLNKYNSFGLRFGH